MGPPGTCQPHIGPMLVPWTLPGTCQPEMGPILAPWILTGTCRPQMGPMLAPWTLPSVIFMEEACTTSKVQQFFLKFWLIASQLSLTHHGPVPHICVAIFSAYFRSAPDMWRWFQCSFPQCPIHGAWQTARSSPVPQIVVARPHLLSHQRPIYVARHGPQSLHVLCGKY